MGSEQVRERSYFPQTHPNVLNLEMQPLDKEMATTDYILIQLLSQGKMNRLKSAVVASTRASYPFRPDKFLCQNFTPVIFYISFTMSLF